MNNPLRSLSKDQLQKVILTGVMTLIALAGVFQFSISRSLKKMGECSSQIQKLQAEIGDVERDARKGRLDADTKAAMRSFVQSQLPNLVSGDPLSWVVREFSDVVEKNPIKAQTPRVGGRANYPKMPGYEVVSVAFEFSGTYDEIGGFVRILEDRFPLSWIQSVQVSGGGNDSGIHQASLEIIFPFQPEKEVKKLQAETTTEKEVRS